MQDFQHAHLACLRQGGEPHGAALALGQDVLLQRAYALHSAFSCHSPVFALKGIRHHLGPVTSL